MGNARNRNTGKVCNICGYVGYGKDIATCSRCKNFEHIYCMENQLFVTPEIWFCEECTVVLDGTVQDTHTKLKIVEDSSNFEKTGIPDKKCLPLNVVPSSRHTSLKAAGKVKFIPAEEVAMLTSGAKISGTRRSSGASSLKTDQAKIKSPPILRRKSTILASSKTPKVLPQPYKGSVDADVRLSPSIGIMTIEHVTDDKQGKIQKNKASGEEVSAALCNEKSNNGSIGAEVHLSSSKRMILAGSECNFNAPPLHINDEQRKRAMDKSSKKEAIVRSSGDHECKVHPLKAHIPVKELRVMHNEIALNSSTAGGSGTAVCSDAQSEKSGSQEMNLQLMLLVNPEEKFPNRRAPEACWKGVFEVFDVVSHVYDGIRAHFPPQVSPKAYEISKVMPEKLKFKTIPRKHVWPQIFQLDPPTKDDIGLYFFPSGYERLKENYIHLLERIDSHDFAMKSCLGDVELLIFTSKQLPMDCQLTGIAAQTYLWGIFCHVNRTKSSHHTRERSPSCSSAASTGIDACGQLNISFEDNCEVTDMEVDMVGGFEIDAPPGFAKPTSEDPDRIKKSLVKFPLKKIAVPSLPDVPPGFSRPPNSDHGIISPKIEIRGVASSFIGGGHETMASEALELHSKRHQVSDRQPKFAKHHRSSPRTPSSEKNQGFDSSEMPDYANEGDLHHDDSELRSTSTNLQSSSAKGKWISMDEIRKKKIEIQRKLNPEGQSRTGGIQERSITVPGKWNTKEQIEGIVKMEYQSEWKPVLSANSDILSLFPEERETIKDFELEQNLASVSEDLSLSRPQYVKDRDSWISTLSKERLEQDGCGGEVRLTL